MYTTVKFTTRQDRALSEVSPPAIVSIEPKETVWEKTDKECNKVKGVKQGKEDRQESKSRIRLQIVYQQLQAFHGNYRELAPMVHDMRGSFKSHNT